MHRQTDGDPEQMPHSAIYYLGLHGLSKNLFVGLQYTICCTQNRPDTNDGLLTCCAIVDQPNGAYIQLQGSYRQVCVKLKDFSRTSKILSYCFQGLETYENTDFCLFCCFTSQVNSYGHCGTVSSPKHTFSWAGLNKRLTSNSCTYFRL